MACSPPLGNEDGSAQTGGLVTMNQQQKEAIHELRAKGQSYTKISELLSISENTIQSYCRRNKLGGVVLPLAEPVIGLFCKMCGAPLKQTQGTKPRQYCSDQCRMLWWNSHPEMVDRRIVKSITCQNCGKTFESYGKRIRKYCSLDCYRQSKAVGT